MSTDPRTGSRWIPFEGQPEAAHAASELDDYDGHDHSLEMLGGLILAAGLVAVIVVLFLVFS